MQRTNDQSQTNSESEDTSTFIEEAVLGEDQPLDESHPGAVGGIVFLTYPIVFISVLLVAFAFFEFFRK